ncbi:hypothetical protein [Neglectibacter timonensis]|uniref:hypothetical protein n=1 Tax=Neglectibacter timonensis TaxID=1776382 RepID=UPI0039A07E1F
MKKRILPITLTAGFLLLVFCGQFFHRDPPRTSSQSDFPYFPNHYEKLGFQYFEPDLGSMAAISDLIILGEVQEVFPPASGVEIPEPGSSAAVVLAKEGSEGLAWTEHPVELKIVQTIQGGLSRGDTLILWRKDPVEGTQPELAPGDRLIFFLRHPDDKYYMTANQCGYYYIAEDNRVYPARVNENLKNTSGMPYGQFIRQIRADKRSFEAQLKERGLPLRKESSSENR